MTGKEAKQKLDEANASRDGIKVIVRYSPYREVPAGTIGTVALNGRMFGGKLAIAFEDISNDRSSYGYFYIAKQNLEIIKESTDMNTTKHTSIVRQMDGKYRVAIIHFIEGSNTDRGYEYACYDDNIVPGDYVVVMSAHHGLGIGCVNTFVPNEGQAIFREIICKADFDAYHRRMECRKTKEITLIKMKERAAELQDILIYKALAQSDPVMQQLLDTLASVSDNIETTVINASLDNKDTEREGI
jgi:hypothetical protein